MTKSALLVVQELTVKQLQSPLPLPTTLPLLSASIAPTKTVIANPVLHLSNHIHDVLHTITFMEAPPHPDFLDDRVRTAASFRHIHPDVARLDDEYMSVFFPQVNALHTLAASLSACIYQALCDSHSYR